MECREVEEYWDSGEKGLGELEEGGSYRGWIWGMGVEGVVDMGSDGD